MIEDVREALEAIREPSLDGRRFSLRPLAISHHRAAYDLTISNNIAFRWRYSGMIPSYERFERSLYNNVLIQFEVVPKNEPQKFVGLVVAYNQSPQDGHAFIAAIMDRKYGAGTFEGIALLVRYLLCNWPFRKLYAEAAEFNVSQFQSGIRAGLLKEEGRLVGHRYYDGRYWDEITYTIYREDAESFVDGRPGFFQSNPGD